MSKFFVALIIYIALLQQSVAYNMEIDNSLQTITIGKLSGDGKSNDVIGNKQLDIRTIRLKGKDWNQVDIDKLIDNFPNTENFVCINCGYFNLGRLSGFKRLKTIYINMLPVIRLKWVYGEEPLQEIELAGLNYDAIKSISISSSPQTNISCKNIGIWNKKLSMSYSGRHNWPLPYKDTYSCFPEIHKLSSLVITGDKQYKAGEIKKAHDNYKKAFFINPYDQRAISSLSLSFYKQKKFCESAQVSASGLLLPNGNQRTRASIYFNHYLAQLGLGNYLEAKKALKLSNDYYPTDSKRDKLENFKVQNTIPENCSFNENWIDKLMNKLESQAIVRSRSDRDNFVSFENLNVKGYKTISTALGVETFDVLTLGFYNLSFEPGYYAVVFKKAPGIDRSEKRRQLILNCGKNITFDNVMREPYVRLDNHIFNKIIEIIKVFEVTRELNNLNCIFGGDGWVLNSNDYVVEVVKLYL